MQKIKELVLETEASLLQNKCRAGTRSLSRPGSKKILCAMKKYEQSQGADTMTKTDIPPKSSRRGRIDRRVFFNNVARIYSIQLEGASEDVSCASF